MSRAKFYTLVYLDQQVVGAVNQKIIGHVQQRELYLKNAACLAKSLAYFGYELTVLTNAPEEIKGSEVYRSYSEPPFRLQQIPFNLPVPTGIKFYAAHYKIDVLRYFSTLGGQYSFLVDSDIVMMRSLSSETEQVINNGCPLVYCISDQMPKTAFERDLEILNPDLSGGEWFGGEFIGGTEIFFADLVSIIDSRIGDYFASADLYNHQGDETLVSAALNRLISRGERVCDINTTDRMLRFWSKVPNHPQPMRLDPKNYCFLHLPSDKAFLAQFGHSFSPDEFSRAYEHYLVKRLPRTLLQKAAKRIKLTH